MALKRIVSTEFWIDDKVMDMFSAEDKYFMLYLLTNPHTTQLGIYKLNCKLAAFELGLSIETVKVLIDRFENKYCLIRYSQTTQEVAIKNYLKHSVITGGTPVYDLLFKEIKQVKNKDLIHYVFDWLKKQERLNITVLKVITDYFNNNKNNENDNENENEKSYNHSLDESVGDSLKAKKRKVIRHKYGQYDNVLLTDEEMEKLHNEFPFDWQERIERLSEYVASTGKSYKNHLATIRSWAKKETKVSYPKAKGNIQDLNDVAIEVEAILEREGW